MYNEYFGFKESPFSIAPDPRYLYMTDQHRDALAHLVYGLNSEGGCILLTGEVGTGKTTICRCLLEQIPKQAKVALVLNPKVSEIELLETICDELKIDYPDANNSAKTYTDRIYKFLIESNRKNEKTVLIIDEAQNLDSKVLEQLRLLTNLETDQRKLLQIIILGQPELLDILARNEMRQLAQRITARFHLQPLTKLELKAYVNHRLAVAGQNICLFPDDCIKLLYKLSDGVPRLVNIICDRALLGAYVENRYAVNKRTMKKAAKEVFGELKNVEKHQKNKQWLYPLIAITSLATIGITTLTYFTYKQSNVNSLIQSEIVSDIEDSLALLNTEVVKRASEDESGNYLANDDEPVEIEISDEEQQQNIAEEVSDNAINEELHPSKLLAGEVAVAGTDDSNSQLKYTRIEDIINNASSTPVSAYQALFSTWAAPYSAETGITACIQAQSASLSCLFKNGNMNNLKMHNRPAVLTLINKLGEPKYVTITDISNDDATIYSDNNKYLVKLSDIDQHWLGKFAIFWKKPLHYSSVVSPGDKGEIINWLNTKITKINNNDAEMIVHTYDESLLNKIKSFQSQQSLTADGIVGPVTIIHLNTITDTNIPTLQQQN